MRIGKSKKRTGRTVFPRRIRPQTPPSWNRKRTELPLRFPKPWRSPGNLLPPNKSPLQARDGLLFTALDGCKLLRAPESSPARPSDILSHGCGLSEVCSQHIVLWCLPAGAGGRLCTSPASSQAVYPLRGKERNAWTDRLSSLVQMPVPDSASTGPASFTESDRRGMADADEDT